MSTTQDQAAPPFEVVVSASEAGERLDRVLAARDVGYSRSALQRFIEEGGVTVDGKPATAKQKLREGAVVHVAPSPPPPSTAQPEDLPLTILHEDDDVLVLDKPAGLVVHPAAGHASGTLVNALLHHAAIERPGDPSAQTRPGIVHRLDKDTSGVMVVAKTNDAREKLIAQFQVHSIERRYRALCVGAPPDAITFDTLHGRHPHDRKRFTTKVLRGKRAVTHLAVVSRFGNAAALVECRLDTGRTHQIRLHLAEHGYPILGDPVYGSAPRDATIRAIGKTLGRQALHAAVLGFVHPRTGDHVRFETAPPPDFEQARACLAASV